VLAPVRGPWLFALAAFVAGCGTVELGENIVQPSTQLSDAYFYCRIQPDVIEASGCASMTANCHQSQSSLRLIDTAGITRPACTGPMNDPPLAPGAVVPPEYMDNFQRVQFTLGSDYASSPFYRRPTMMDSHPVLVFPTTDPKALLIRDWFATSAP
jgi:hypothetical protein